MATIYICSNNETLADGVIADRQRYDEHIDDAVLQTCREFDNIGDIEIECKSLFHDWHGGKFYRAGAKIDGKKYGYRCGHVATLEVEPSAELIALVDKIADSLDARLTAIGLLEDQENDAEVAAEFDAE